MGEDKPSPLAASRVRLLCLGESTDGDVIDPVVVGGLQRMAEDKPSPLAASTMRLQCLGESTDGEVIDPAKARSSLEASKE